MSTRKPKTTRTNTVAPERLAEAFYDLPICQQAQMLETFRTIHHLACRLIHLNRDITPKLPPPPDGESTEDMAARMARELRLAHVPAFDGADSAYPDSEGGDS